MEMPFTYEKLTSMMFSIKNNGVEFQVLRDFEHNARDLVTTLNAAYEQGFNDGEGAHGPM